MGDLERRLERLEQRRSQGEGGEPQVSPETYDWIRGMAREDIEESHANGTEPIYRITEAGEVQTADGRPIRDFRDYMVALDERIAELEEEIAAEGGEFDPGPITGETRRRVEEKVDRMRDARETTSES